MKLVIRILLFGGFGLLPLWFSIAVVWSGGEGRAATSEYWAAAPWFVVMGAMASAVTLAMAAVPWVVYERTRGDTTRRLKFAMGSFAAVCALAVVTAGLIGFRMRGTESNRTYLKHAAERLVLGDPRVIALAGLDARATSLSSATFARNPVLEFQIYVSGKTPVHARVRASSGDRDAELSLLCMSLTSFAATPSDELPCKDPL